MDSKAVYIKGSPVNVDEASIRDVMADYGTIAEVTIPEDRDFCFVSYENEAAAQAACAAATVTIDGHEATVEARRGSRRGPRSANGGPGGGGGRRGAGGNSVPEGTSHSIYIHAVDPSTSRDDITAVFAPFGNVGRVQLRSSVNGRRYAFVEFDTAEVVQAVLQGGPYVVAGEEVTVEERHTAPRPPRARRERDEARGDRNERRSKPEEGGDEANRAPRGRLGTPPKPENSVYIKGFPADTKEDDIRQLFSAYGEIKSVIVRVKPSEDDDIRTWAFVEYASPDEVEAAVNSTASGLDIGGQEVVVEARKSEPKLYRRGGGGRGGGGRG